MFLQLICNQNLKEKNGKDEGVQMMKNSPTILQTMYNLDTTTIKDKESILKIINEMTTKEKQTTEQVEVTTYVSVFENTAKNADTTAQVEASTKKEMAPMSDQGKDQTTMK